MNPETADHFEHLYLQRLGLEVPEERYAPGWDERETIADADELNDEVYLAIRRSSTKTSGPCPV